LIAKTEPEDVEEDEEQQTWENPSGADICRTPLFTFFKIQNWDCKTFSKIIVSTGSDLAAILHPNA
jgi:hypothetical protein